MKKKIGIIGFGNMGSTLAQNLKSQSERYEVWVSDKDKGRLVNIPGINIARTNQELADSVDVILLAIKPQEFETVMPEIKGQIKGQVIISIAAGITIDYIEKHLGDVKVVRAMPNMAARVGQGVTCLCKGKFASESDFYLAQRLFYSLGKTIRIEESMMNAATAVSGSGPAYFFDFIESKGIDYNDIPEKIKQDFINSLEKAARAIGFNIAEAAFLANATVNGSEALIKTTNISPFELKKQITSKGGTTEAALEVLHKGGSLEEAVKAALKRAQEVSKKG